MKLTSGGGDQSSVSIGLVKEADGAQWVAHSGPQCPMWSTVGCKAWTKCTALATLPTFNGPRPKAKFYFHTKLCPKEFTPGIWQPSPHSYLETGLGLNACSLARIRFRLESAHAEYIHVI